MINTAAKNEVLNISLQKLITDEPDIAQKCSGPAAVNTNWQEFKIYWQIATDNGTVITVDCCFYRCYISTITADGGTYGIISSEKNCAKRRGSGEDLTAGTSHHKTSGLEI